MIYKIVLVFVFLFSLKTFSAEQQVSESSSKEKDNLAQKQLEIIIKSIKDDNNTSKELESKS